MKLDGIDPAITLLISTPDTGDPLRVTLRPNTIFTQVTADQGSAARAFHQHWKPDLCLWGDGASGARLLSETHDHGVPTIMIGVRAEQLEQDRWPWRSGRTRNALNRVERALTAETEAGQRLQRLGLPPDRIEPSGRLLEGGAALGCDMAELEKAGAMLGARPVWLAAMATAAECSQLASAHRAASRSAHRLLLVLVPQTPDDGAAIVADMREAGWSVAQRSMGEPVDDITEVYVADTSGEMGLWYRLAPITFMGASLAGGTGGRDPFEPAALGSAILYGPNVGLYLKSYSRLAGAGAARIVKDASSLAQGIQRLLAPDQAAVQAHAAWDVASQGAEVTDRILELVTELLEDRRLL